MEERVTFQFPNKEMLRFTTKLWKKIFGPIVQSRIEQHIEGNPQEGQVALGRKAYMPTTRNTVGLIVKYSIEWISSLYITSVDFKRVLDRINDREIESA